MYTQITNRYACTVKLHIPSDVGLALIKYNPTFKKMNQKDKSQFLDEFEGKKACFMKLTVASIFSIYCQGCFSLTVFSYQKTIHKDSA